MIAKADWFTTRRFGWGLGVKGAPGWAYIAGAIILFGLASIAPVEAALKPYLMGALFVLFLADLLSIVPKVYAKLDERENMHQLVAERNASFAGVATLVGILAYNTYSMPTGLPSDIGTVSICAGVLVVMAVAKGATLLYQER